MTLESLTTLLDNFLDNPKVNSFRLMTQGKENTTALVEMPNGKVIVRMWGETHGYMGAHSEDDIENEVAFMSFCYDNGIPVPKLLRSKADKLYEKSPEGRPYAIMEYVDGDSPLNFTEGMTTQIAETMAHAHLLVNDFAFPKLRSWPGTVLDMTNERIARFETGELGANPDITEAITHYRTLLEECDLASLPRGVIHGDIMWENMKFKDGKLQGVFDFGDCRESYFVEDIAKSLLFAFESSAESIFGEDGDNVPIFLQSYQTVRKLTAAEKHSLPLFFMSRILYQYIGYQAKVAKGQAEYAAKADDTVARYRQHLSFFVSS